MYLSNNTKFAKPVLLSFSCVGELDIKFGRSRGIVKSGALLKSFVVKEQYMPVAEARDMLEQLGVTLSHSVMLDVTIEFSIIGAHNIYEINYALSKHG